MAAKCNCAFTDIMEPARCAKVNSFPVRYYWYSFDNIDLHEDLFCGTTPQDSYSVFASSTVR